MSGSANGSVGGRLVVYWAIAGIPLLWGVWQTLSNVIKLFQ